MFEAGGELGFRESFVLNILQELSALARFQVNIAHALDAEISGKAAAAIGIDIFKAEVFAVTLVVLEQLLVERLRLPVKNPDLDWIF